MNLESLSILEQYLDEVTPWEFYKDLFGGYLSVRDNPDIKRHPEVRALHGTIVNYSGEGKRYIKVFDNLDGVFSVQGLEHRACAMPPVAYIGTTRSNNNARWLFAIAIDVDELARNGVRELFHQMNKIERVPKATYIVWSGSGLHLYYVLENPVKCYPSNMRKLLKLKTALTRLIWNAYVTDKYKTPEIESITQCMRVVGSGIKEEEGDAVARAFRHGDPVALDYLDSFVDEENRCHNLEHDGFSKAYCKKVFPKWYSDKIENGNGRKYWTCHRGLYDKWLERVKTESLLNHRYFAVFCLAIYAIKSGVPFEELERDALALIPVLDELTEEEKNHFTEKDVRSALKGYNEKYKTVPIKWIVNWSAIPIKENRRNGNSRRVHLVGARALRDARRKEEGLPPWNGRKKKDAVVRAWRKENPQGTKAECIRQTGLTRPTVSKWWTVQVESFEDASEFLEELNPVQRYNMIDRHGETIRGFLESVTE